MQSNNEAPVLTKAEQLRAKLASAKAHVPTYAHELWARREAAKRAEARSVAA